MTGLVLYTIKPSGHGANRFQVETPFIRDMSVPIQSNISDARVLSHKIIAVLQMLIHYFKRGSSLRLLLFQKFQAETPRFLFRL